MPSPELLHEIATRLNVAEWIAIERRDHADPKWHEGDNRTIAIKHMEDDPEWWTGYIHSYVHRAEILGLDSSSGRQALGKAIVTAMAALETAVSIYGPLPKPGVPSGTIEDFTPPNGPTTGGSPGR